MTFLLRLRKCDLQEVARELGLEVNGDLTKVEIKYMILQNDKNDIETIKAVMEGILEEKEREFEERRQTENMSWSVKSPLDDVCHRLPLAKVKFKTKGGEFYTKAAVKVNSHPSEPNLLSNRTAKLIQSREKSVLMIEAKMTRNANPVFPTQGDGTEPTIEFPAFVEKNEEETAQLKNFDFSSEQNKCKDQHVLWDRAKWGVSECCRTKEGNLERVVGTKREEEFRKLGVPLKFTLEINQLSHLLSDSLVRVQGILKLALKALCEERREKRIL
ncbi:uncharacterized protein TNCV_2212221 [Trichonephila clavipes]|nr:uncharacterized protein TNCV_2212221 [Trichonephila clavipes]